MSKKGFNSYLMIMGFASSLPIRFKFKEVGYNNGKRVIYEPPKNPFRKRKKGGK